MFKKGKSKIRAGFINNPVGREKIRWLPGHNSELNEILGQH